MIDAVLLSHSLKQRRDDMRRLLGERYAETVKPFRDVLWGYVSQTGQPIALVTLKIAKEMDAAGVDPSCLFAAFVDEVENA